MGITTENNIISLGVFYNNIKAWFSKAGITVGNGLTGVLNATTEVESSYSLVWKASGVRGCADGGSWLHPYARRHGSVSCSGKSAANIVAPQKGVSEWREGTKDISACTVNGDAGDWSIELSNVTQNTTIKVYGATLLGGVYSWDGTTWKAPSAGSYVIAGKGEFVVISKVEV